MEISRTERKREGAEHRARQNITDRDASQGQKSRYIQTDGEARDKGIERKRELYR